MKAIVIEPGKPAELREIGDQLHDVRELVKGYIEAVRLASDVVMLVDEEGLLKQKPLNEAASLLARIQIVGTAVIVGQYGAEWGDVPGGFAALALR